MSPRNILKRLGLGYRTSIPQVWLGHIIDYAFRLIALQRAIRLVHLGADNRHEEIYRELDSMSKSNTVLRRDLDWILIQIEGNFSIRNLQGQIALEMIFPSSGENSVMQLNMGEGKSSVIIPIVAATLAKGRSLLPGLEALLIARSTICRLDDTFDRLWKTLKLFTAFTWNDVPSLRAEFGHPDVTILLTCLSYYYQGLSEAQLVSCFEMIHKLDNPALEYDHWILQGGGVPQEYSNLKGINIKDTKQFQRDIVPLFSYNSAVINFYLSAFVFPRSVKEFPHKLVSSAWDLAATKVHPTTGFSGTNDNRYLLPTSIAQVDPLNQSGTNALILDILLRPENGYYQCVQRSGDTASARDFIDSLVIQNPTIDILLDVGAQILDMTNEELSAYDVPLYILSNLLSEKTEHSPFIICGIILHENRPQDLDGVPPNLQTWLSRDRVLSHRLGPSLMDYCLAHPQVLCGSIAHVWSGFLPQSGGWSRGANSRSLWLTSKTHPSGKVMQRVDFNLGEGRLLIDGLPIGRIPVEYVNHPLYARLFGKRVINVVPSSIPGMTFTARSEIDGYQVSFALNSKKQDLIVQAQAGLISIIG
ncbi:unnamed protein product [Rhizoctonia solani]|uniref:ubiquitinyl hydrolase 1 n=1 Tax=Rhizoctonia solani TaxID=456999 RepID=A0A8H3DY47_9AGAM|nr:unnamed protein product [Rhizoctonia solani]